MGGTEILAPLKAIFEMYKPKQEQETHVFLMTDGAVSNGNEICALIRQHAAPNMRLHSFGFGSGADERLIKTTAEAGKGRFYFIHNASEIFERVIKSLINTHLEYLVVKQLEITDTTGRVQRFNFDDIRVTQGEIVEWSTLLDPGVQARAYTWILEDPNTKMLNRYNGTFNNVES